MLFSGIAASAPIAFAPGASAFVVGERSIEEDQGTDNQRNCRHYRATRSTTLGNRGALVGRTLTPDTCFHFSSPQFLRNMWIAEVIFVEINQVQPQPVLYLTFAQVMQVRPPVSVLR